ncbi:hypothetical protein PaeCFBP13512_22395 [Paenibacillus sp. CFBP13512]|uniref:hypothetical protein n=1 Tax=Paenibacillus sp. CFBP13512 TaxID=2184007 RepID=UPI0010BFD620|nr:hypothetical protein [Paenibacillus sp. CFBP13512]TKJ83769.1 hypothetical protein PaeCFBP13512_22395 [Paenibacillus sp. CFBP13512]
MKKVEDNKPIMHVVGGQRVFPTMTNKLTEKEYMVIKAFAWSKLLGDRMLPVKWLKPSTKGTKVNFNMAKNQGEFDKDLTKFKDYITEVNELYPDVGITID